MSKQKTKVIYVCKRCYTEHDSNVKSCSKCNSRDIQRKVVRVN